MGLILGLYWAVGTNLTVRISQDLTDGAGFSIAHQQMFGLALFSYLAEKMNKGVNNKSKTFRRYEVSWILTNFYLTKT